MTNHESGTLQAVGDSVLRLSGALAALGFRQAAHLLEGRSGNPRKAPRPASAPGTSPADAVLNRVEEQLGGAFRGLYRAGRGYVDGELKVRF